MKTKLCNCCFRQRSVRVFSKKSKWCKECVKEYADIEIPDNELVRDGGQFGMGA